jgi:hypothetical protein
MWCVLPSPAQFAGEGPGVRGPREARRRCRFARRVRDARPQGRGSAHLGTVVSCFGGSGRGVRGAGTRPVRGRHWRAPRGALSPVRLFARSSQRRPTPPPTSGEGCVRSSGRLDGHGCQGMRCVLPSPAVCGRGAGGEGSARSATPFAVQPFRVRNARPQGREPGAEPHGSIVRLCGGGSAHLGTVLSCPSARAARPGAQRRGTPKPVVAVSFHGGSLSPER